MPFELDQAQWERGEAMADFQNNADEWQTMEGDIDETFGKNEALRKRMADWQACIGRIVEHIERRVNSTDDPSLYQAGFESLSTEMPDSLSTLHDALMQLLAQNNLHDLNETRMLSDYAVLEQLFGKIEIEEDEQPQSEQHALDADTAALKLKVSALRRAVEEQQHAHKQAVALNESVQSEMDSKTAKYRPTKLSLCIDVLPSIDITWC